MSVLQMKKLTDAREKVDDIKQRRMRLQGELDVHHKHLSELEERSRAEYDCEVDDLPDLIEKLEREGAEAVSSAEKLLGIAE